MLPNLLDDLLRAWETHPPTLGSPETGDESRAEQQPQPHSPVQAEAQEQQAAVEQESPAPETQVPLEQPFVPAFIEPPQTLLPSDPFGTLLAGLLAESDSAVPQSNDSGTVMDSLLTSLLANFDPPAATEPQPLAPPPPPVAELPVRHTLPIAIAAPAGRKYVAVAMGLHKFALPIESVLEVGRCPKVTYVPGLAPHVKGVFSFRGEVVPVVNVRTLGGVSSESETAVPRFPENQDSFSESLRIVAVQTSNGRSRAALIFDSLEGIVSIDSDSPGLPASHLRLKEAKEQYPLASALTSVCLHDTTQFGLISIDRLLEEAGCTEGTAAR